MFLLSNIPQNYYISIHFRIIKYSCEIFNPEYVTRGITPSSTLCFVFCLFLTHPIQLYLFMLFFWKVAMPHRPRWIFENLIRVPCFVSCWSPCSEWESCRQSAVFAHKYLRHSFISVCERTYPFPLFPSISTSDRSNHYPFHPPITTYHFHPHSHA